MIITLLLSVAFHPVYKCGHMEQPSDMVKCHFSQIVFPQQTPLWVLAAENRKYVCFTKAANSLSVEIGFVWFYCNLLPVIS